MGKSGGYKLENVGTGARHGAAKNHSRDSGFVKAKTTAL
jgi:hypothetical protein